MSSSRSTPHLKHTLQVTVTRKLLSSFVLQSMPGASLDAHSRLVAESKDEGIESDYAE